MSSSPSWGIDMSVYTIYIHIHIQYVLLPVARNLHHGSRRVCFGLIGVGLV